MFYKMIEKTRDRWYSSQNCTVIDLVEYMIHQGHLRDAQIEAIKTYLYLKIAWSCQSLKRLFVQGAFNSLDLDELALSSGAREYLKSHKAAAALLEYACLVNDAGEQVSPKLEQQIKKEPEAWIIRSSSETPSMVFPIRTICSACLWVRVRPT